MTSCRQIAESASDHIDGYGRTRVRRMVFLWHLWRCHSCRDFVSQLKMTVELMGLLRSSELPRNLESLQTAFREQFGSDREQSAS